MTNRERATQALEDLHEARKRRFKHKERVAVRAVGLCLMDEMRKAGKHYSKAQERILRAGV